MITTVIWEIFKAQKFSTLSYRHGNFRLATSVTHEKKHVQSIYYIRCSCLNISRMKRAKDSLPDPDGLSSVHVYPRMTALAGQPRSIL